MNTVSDRDDFIEEQQSADTDYVDSVEVFAMAFGYPYGKDRGMTLVTADWGSSAERLPMTYQYHHHSHYELIYVLDGVFTQHLESAKYTLNAGDVTLMNSNIRHCEGGETDAVCVYLNMPQQFLDQLFHNNGISPKLPQHSSRTLAAFCGGERAEGRAALNFYRVIGSSGQPEPHRIQKPHQILDQLAKAMIEREWGWAYTAQGLLLQFFAELENPDSYHITNIRTDTNPEEILFMNIQHYMRERNGRVSRTELAEVLHYNQDYIGRVVKRRTGLSYMQYSQQLWLDRAKELLKQTDMSVTEIIRYLKFENRHYFYRIFSEVTGMTPQEYRQNTKQA